MLRLLIRAEFNQGKPRDVVGFWSLKQNFMYLAIWGKAYTLPFLMDLHYQFFNPDVFKKPCSIQSLDFQILEKDSQSILEVVKIYFSLTCLGIKGIS